jgi:hypothetical protein
MRNYSTEDIIEQLDTLIQQQKDGLLAVQNATDNEMVNIIRKVGAKVEVLNQVKSIFSRE